MTWHDTTRHDIIWHYMTWHDMTLYDMIWHDIWRHYMTWHDIIWHDTTRHEIIWHDMTSRNQSTRRKPAMSTDRHLTIYHPTYSPVRRIYINDQKQLKFDHHAKFCLDRFARYRISTVTAPRFCASLGAIHLSIDTLLQRKFCLADFVELFYSC